jgi:hypothetical protein
MKPIQTAIATTLALQARCGAAAGAQGGREDVRRLGGRDDSGVRSAHRRSLAAPFFVAALGSSSISTPTSTVSSATLCTNLSRFGPHLPPSRSYTKARAWRLTRAAAGEDRPPPIKSIAPRAAAHIWSEHPRACPLGPQGEETAVPRGWPFAESLPENAGGADSTRTHSFFPSSLAKDI